MAEDGSGGEAARVVIIGAGASGIAAASRLLANCVDDIIILEAQDYIGGRVRNVPSPDNRGADMGAHWIHGEIGNIAYELAEPLGLVVPSGDHAKPLSFVRTDGSKIDSSPALLEFFDNIFHHNLSGNPQHNSSMATYLLEELERSREKLELDHADLDRIASYILKSMCVLEGCGKLSDVSTKLIDDYHECEGDQLNMFKKEGYNNILDVLMRTHEVFGGKNPLPVKEKVKFNERVNSIDWSGEKAIVKTESGGVYTADKVIISVSLAVLKAGNIKFTPSLPKVKDEAIKALGIDVVNKIYLFFEERWWPDDIAGYALLQEPPQEGSHWSDFVISFFAQSSNPTALVGWVVGDAAREMEADSDAEVLAACERLLSKFVGPTQAVPPIKGMLRSRWWSNKDIKGSYSYQSIAAEKVDQPRAALARPMRTSDGTPIVRWAGEATNLHKFSTVHGAVESGFREADAILKSFNKIERVKAIVIGAGVAGLSAAKTLVEEGHTSVLVLEAQEVIGGRVRSEWTGDSWAELGAQWIHGTDQPLYKIAAKKGLIAPYNSVEGKGKYLREDSSEIPASLVEEIFNLMESTLEDCELLAFCKENSQTVGLIMEEEFSNYVSKTDKTNEEIEMMRDLLQWHVRWQEIDNSCYDLCAMGVDTWGAFRMSTGEKNNNPVGAMSQVIEELATLAGVHVTTDCPVLQIDSSADLIKIISEKGKVYEAEHVIFTGSIAVIKNSPGLFYPPLPTRLIQSLDCKGMDLVVKIFLKYDNPWWSDSGYQLVWSRNSSEQGWVRYTTGVEVVDGRQNTLLAWIGNRGAAVVESLEETQIGVDFTRALRKFTGRTDIPLPSKVVKSNWGRNPFVKGAYSFLRKTWLDSGQLVHEVLATPVTKTLPDKKILSVTLAGEGIHKDLYSTLQGAYLSGQEQAQKICKFILWNESVQNSIKN